MPKGRKPAKKPAIPLDRALGKRAKGRPAKMPASEVFGRAENYRFILGEVWQRLRGRLLQAQTEEDVIKAFEENAKPYAGEFVPPLAPLILQVLRDPRFPKREPKPRKGTLKSRKSKSNPRIVFLADSLAGRGVISLRRSRDICERERKKKVHQIIREESYIVCSCGYKGHSLHGRCPRCGPKDIFIPLLEFSP